MKPTLKDNGKIWLFRHKVFGLSAAKFEVQDDLLWCWVIGDEEPHGAFSGEFEWLGPAQFFGNGIALTGASPDNL